MCCYRHYCFKNIRHFCKFCTDRQYPLNEWSGPPDDEKDSCIDRFSLPLFERVVVQDSRVVFSIRFLPHLIDVADIPARPVL